VNLYPDFKELLAEFALEAVDLILVEGVRRQAPTAIPT
jgi:hypothetical protein